MKILILKFFSLTLIFQLNAASMEGLSDYLEETYSQNSKRSKTTNELFQKINSMLENDTNLNDWSDNSDNTPLVSLIYKISCNPQENNKIYFFIEQLLKKSANPNHKGEGTCNNPLRAAVQKSEYNEDGLKILELLLKYNADPNLVDDVFTPLTYAIVFANLKAIKILLKFGADPNVKIANLRTTTALHAIINQVDQYAPTLTCSDNHKKYLINRSEILYKGTVNLLLYGANPFCTNDQNKTPIDCALEIGDKRFEKLLTQTPIKLIKFYELYLVKVLKFPKDIVSIIIKMLLPYYPIQEQLTQNTNK